MVVLVEIIGELNKLDRVFLLPGYRFFHCLGRLANTLEGEILIVGSRLI